MTLRRLLFMILLLMSGVYASAQSAVTIISNPWLDSLVLQHAEANKAQPTLEGFRIQLFSGIERNNANALRQKFRLEYPDEPVYLIYQQPYFKLRVGDYRNQIEAQQMYLKLQKTYGQILVVPDRINLPKL